MGVTYTKNPFRKVPHTWCCVVPGMTQRIRSDIVVFVHTMSICSRLPVKMELAWWYRLSRVDTVRWDASDNVLLLLGYNNILKSNVLGYTLITVYVFVE